MTKLKYVGLLALAILTSSCEKLLQEDPKFSINSKTAFETESTANIALNGCYGYLTTTAAYGQQITEVLIATSGLAWSQTNKSENDLMASLTTPATTGFIKVAWGSYYKVIGQCNFFISSVTASNLSDDYKKQSIAQAKFLRGFAYFNLANMFGDVPLRLDPTSTTTIAAGRTARATIYAQVEKDWLEAAEDLKTKEQLGIGGVGKATKYAAYAYLAKFYFTLASHDNVSSSPYWAKAKVMGDKVILDGKYDLEPLFSKLFTNYISNSPESIFQLNFSTTSASTGNRTSWVVSPANSTTGISFGRERSSKAFYDLFKGTYIDDPRINVTFATTWKSLNNNQQQFSYPYVRSGNLGTASAPIFKAIDSIKYETLSNPTNPKVSEVSALFATNFIKKVGDHQGWPYFKKAMDVTATAQFSNRNIILFRYADFLLLMADVENELNNKDKAVEYINKVLTRARTSATPASINPKNVLVTISKDDLRDKVFFERLFELGGEVETFFDTRRRGVDYFSKIVVGVHNSHNITNAFIDFATANGNVTNFRDRLLPATADLLKKNLLLPIPTDEINTNDEIGESDQNFGY
ncbi:RagB/SusD family nutrient uptake outer membrane protein [Pedobacter arcticus]|uniref:RagB/SusD family nutrient uptake outer membrane protein n=1 Tax=Pedobacter arcticus TaxID=752140 RepID=UPI0002D447CC|nr:RagB/SusD family nutrient uptake outer membrane protein [Pedobacter arcticus]